MTHAKAFNVLALLKYRFSHFNHMYVQTKKTVKAQQYTQIRVLIRSKYNKLIIIKH